MDVRSILEQLSEEKYRDFSMSLLPNVDNILGVRVPVLRKLAKRIYKSDWKMFISSDTQYYEEVMLQGFVIALSENIELVENFIPKINNWGVCDSFCASLKFTKKNKEVMFKSIQKYLKSNEEFKLRFALVLLLDYFVEEEYIDRIFEILNKFHSDKYYAQMASAWLISVCCIKFPEKTEKFLKNTNIDDFTYNKSIQKIIESYRIDKALKDNFRLMKR